MARFNRKAIENTDNDRPVVYTLKQDGDPIYVGIAKRGRVQDRVLEHLGEIPATEFLTRSYDTVAEAREAEERKIKREKPRYNDKHNS